MIILLSRQEALKLYKRFTNLCCRISFLFICTGQSCPRTIRHHKQPNKVAVEEVKNKDAIDLTPPSTPGSVSNTLDDSTSSHSIGLAASTSSPIAPIPPSTPESVRSNPYPTPPASPTKQWHGFSGIPNLGYYLLYE